MEKKDTGNICTLTANICSLVCRFRSVPYCLLVEVCNRDVEVDKSNMKNIDSVRTTHRSLINMKHVYSFLKIFLKHFPSLFLYFWSGFFQIGFLSFDVIQKLLN